MIVISNHVKSIGLEYPAGSLIRINLAWVHSVEEIERIIEDSVGHLIWLDYPTGRRKPPRPSMTLDDAIKICERYYERIAYFAFSNAEDPDTVAKIRERVAASVKLAPKIETKTGVTNLSQIILAAGTDLIMLDKEDLYVDCDTEPTLFNKYVDMARQTCANSGIVCLELKGVVFGYEAV